MRRILFLCAAALVILAAACSRAGVEEQTGGDSGVQGIVMLGPTCPVETVSSPCPDRPIAADITVAGSTGGTTTAARSGPDGRFRVALRPGTYILSAQQVGSAMGFAAPVSVTVRDGAFTQVTLHVDSGIR